jgi:hypothetical protein
MRKVATKFISWTYSILVCPDTALRDLSVVRLGMILLGLVALQSGNAFNKAAYPVGHERAEMYWNFARQEGVSDLEDARLLIDFDNQQRRRAMSAAKAVIFSAPRLVLTVTSILFAVGLLVNARACTVSGVLEAVVIASTTTTLAGLVVTALSSILVRSITEPTLGLIGFAGPATNSLLDHVRLPMLWWAIVAGAALARTWRRPTLAISAPLVSVIVLWMALTHAD